MKFATRYDGEWKPWFAWHPVRLGQEWLRRDGPWVWLERVERRCFLIGSFHYTVYRHKDHS